MTLIELILLAIGLSMDASAVSISNSICIRKITAKHLLQMAVAFALFQGIMPVIGYFAASTFSSVINRFDHWIAFILLVIIGGKMIYEAINAKEKEDCDIFNLTLKLLMLQAVATSIDALAVGVSLSALKVNIFYATGIISLVTFICCSLAVLVSKRFGNMLGKRADIVGGIILIAIGAKIFLEHSFFGG